MYSLLITFVVDKSRISLCFVLVAGVQPACWRHPDAECLR